MADGAKDKQLRPVVEGQQQTNDNNKKQQSTNVRRQRRRTYVAAEAEDNNGWQEAGHGVGGRGATVVRRQRRNSFTIRPWRMEVEDRRGGAGWGVHFFFFSWRG
jgi:hypothetical protein